MAGRISRHATRPSAKLHRGRLRRRPWGRFRRASVPGGPSSRLQRASVFLGGLGPTAGTWSGVGAARRRAGARGSCITRQSSSIAPALPCYACHTCVARHGLAGSARLSSYACPARRDQSEGRPHPPQVPAVRPRTPRHRPGGSRPRPQGTDALRNGLVARPARHPASPRPGPATSHPAGRRRRRPSNTFATRRHNLAANCARPPGPGDASREAQLQLEGAWPRTPKS